MYNILYSRKYIAWISYSSCLKVALVLGGSLIEKSWFFCRQNIPLEYSTVMHINPLLRLPSFFNEKIFWINFLTNPKYLQLKKNHEIMKLWSVFVEGQNEFKVLILTVFKKYIFCLILKIWTGWIDLNSLNVKYWVIKKL